jgi:hypothetical protein
VKSYVFLQAVSTVYTSRRANTRVRPGQQHQLGSVGQQNSMMIQKYVLKCWANCVPRDPVCLSAGKKWFFLHDRKKIVVVERPTGTTKLERNAEEDQEGRGKGLPRYRIHACSDSNSMRIHCRRWASGSGNPAEEIGQTNILRSICHCGPCRRLRTLTLQS